MDFTKKSIKYIEDYRLEENNVANLFCLVGIGILGTLRFFNLTVVTIPFQLEFMVTAIFLLGIGAFLQGKSKSVISYIVYFFILISALISFSKQVQSGSLYLQDPVFVLAIIIFITISRKQVRLLIKIMFFLKLIWLSLLVVLLKVGIISNVANFTGRESLGFLNPNGLGAVSLFLGIECLYLFRKNINKLVIPVLIAEFFMYKIDGSRTSFGCFFMFILIYWCTNESKKNTSLKKILCVLPFGITLTGFIYPVFYNINSVFWSRADTLFSGRIKYVSYFLEQIGLSWFGKPIPNTFYVNAMYSVSWKDEYILDPANYRILLQFGVALTIVVYVYVIFKSILAIKHNLLFEYSCIIIILIYSMLDRAAYNVALFPIELIFLEIPINYCLKKPNVS